MNSDQLRFLVIWLGDILAIPVLTVASESTFSYGGRVVDPSRCSWLLKQWKLSYVLKLAKF
uniref:HAT C-terminal dimerisation domain-containing protein n=1 Tax=Cucumis melo TaxID=3656 RepID=A0A9I9EE24_CUCME